MRSSSTSKRRRITAVAVAFAIGGAISGCGGSSDPPGPTVGDGPADGGARPQETVVPHQTSDPTPESGQTLPGAPPGPADDDALPPGPAGGEPGEAPQ